MRILVSLRRHLAGTCVLLFLAGSTATADDATAVVSAAIEYWRDTSSYSVIEMTIYRPDWERTTKLRVWTRGQKDSLVRVLAPAKDAGSGTLLSDGKMWTFSPKINRVIKIPSSMMNQGWMGSDFSNNDIAKADDLIDHYRHRYLGSEQRDGHKVHIIESTPLETAPVVWGKEVLKIRDDHILLEHAFFDQDGVLLKKLVTTVIGVVGGKTIAKVERMQKVDRPNEWTQIEVKEAQFGIVLSESLFTLSNLRNPRNLQ